MWGTFLQGYVGTLMLATYVRAIGRRTLYVRVFGGVRGYVDGHSHKTVLRTLLKKRGPAIKTIKALPSGTQHDCAPVTSF